MEIKRFSYDFTICKITDLNNIQLDNEFTFISKTDEELSLVCKTIDAPSLFIEREDNWKMMRIQGVLDFSLIGILAKISTILAKHNIGIFVISTYNTDYILVKKDNYEKALNILNDEGYKIV